jgi:glycosyltransferase involved in cell wall biosynthesis
MDPSQKFGSLEEQIAGIASAFRERGSLFLPLFIVSHLPEQPTPLERAGVPIACLEMGGFSWHVLASLLSLMRRFEIEAVHWNFTEPIRNSYLWWLTLLKPGVRHYYTDHISRLFPLPQAPRAWKRRLQRLLLKRYKAAVCVSGFVLECLKTQGTWSNVVCCRHFINIARFSPDIAMRTATRAKCRVHENFVVLAVAHLIEAKGIDVALRALALLPDRVVLWVVGTGAEATNLQRLSAELGVSARVKWHGSQEYVQHYMQAADCFVCPSLWAEAAGLVNLEAQASGLPVIASNVGGIPEYVADGITGLLFPAGDARELAERVRCLLHDTPLCERLGKAARARVVKQFSPAARLDDMLAIYQP